uniref:Transmembrane protein n=1 Tax=Angiostrongylus cantonensis TaxID=6313 RepID=A0A0K0DEE0_ANGCA
MSCTNHRMHTGRCLCIHSSLQCLDLAIQSLLLNHGFLPFPLSLSIFALSFYSVIEVLRGVFRSKHRRSIREVAICVGPHPHRIRHLYSRVPVSVCEDVDSHDENCGSPCSELSDVEKRRINRQLFIVGFKESRHTGQRMFVFIRGYDSLLREDIEER